MDIQHNEAGSSSSHAHQHGGLQHGPFTADNTLGFLQQLLNQVASGMSNSNVRPTVKQTMSFGALPKALQKAL
eukprot:2831004-Lingulodinium_polyedra.AAC.1